MRTPIEPTHWREITVPAGQDLIALDPTGTGRLCIGIMVYQGPVQVITSSGQTVTLYQGAGILSDSAVYYPGEFVGSAAGNLNVFMAAY